MITSKHKGKSPATYNNGSYPIDDFFASSGLKIKECGYLSHGENCSDHRPIWVDLTTTSVFGANPPTVMSIKARRLKTTDPRIVKKYNTILEEEFERNNIYTRVLKLYNVFSNNLTPEQCAEFDVIDRLRSKAMKKAERKCRKLHMGAIPWSPQLHHAARELIQYIKLMIRKKKGRKIGARTLIRLQRKAKCNLKNHSIEELEKELDVAYKLYKNLKKEAESLRLAFLEALAISLEAEGKGKKAKIIEGMIKLEEQRKMYRKLKPLSRKFSENLSTTSVILTNNGITHELTEKVQMEQAIIDENRKKYHQCETACPFMSEPLLSEFGAFGENTATERVLKGTYKGNFASNDLMPNFLDACKGSTKCTSMERSVNNFKQSWK